jgi:hypothetical protein
MPEQLKEFSAGTWETFSGAEKFADGSAPQYGNRGSAVLVVDGQGIGLYSTLKSFGSMQWSPPPGYGVGKADLLAFAEMLLNAPTNPSAALLCALGFEPGV